MPEWQKLRKVILYRAVNFADVLFSIPDFIIWKKDQAMSAIFFFRFPTFIYRKTMSKEVSYLFSLDIYDDFEGFVNDRVELSDFYFTRRFISLDCKVYRYPHLYFKGRPLDG